VVLGAGVAGLVAISFRTATPAAAQCATAPLITFEGIAVSYQQQDAPTRFAWTFRLTVQPAGLSLPDTVVVVVAHDPPAGSTASSVEGSLGVAIQPGARYRVTAQSIAAADGTTSYVADACGGSYQVQAPAGTAVATSDPIFGTRTPTTVDVGHAASKTWKVLLGGVGILAVVGGVVRTATGRRRN
jgi:hypothetical protein